MQRPRRNESESVRFEAVLCGADHGRSVSVQIIDQLVAFMLMKLDIGVLRMISMEKKQQTIHFLPSILG
ncbi:hypothetical protein D3C73_1409850 [compost metagenome]